MAFLFVYIRELCFFGELVRCKRLVRKFGGVGFSSSARDWKPVVMSDCLV